MLVGTGGAFEAADVTGMALGMLPQRCCSLKFLASLRPSLGEDEGPKKSKRQNLQTKISSK
jgi:hypothetical protein